MNIGNSTHHWNIWKLIPNRHVDIRGTLGNQYIIGTFGT